MSEEYEIGGLPESPDSYIEYCQKNGTFLATHVPIPSKEKALLDLEVLQASKLWRQIIWDVSEERTLDYMRAQARRISGTSEKKMVEK